MVDYTQAPNYVTDSSGRRQFADRDKVNGVAGTSLVEADQNMNRNELVYLVKTFGLTPNGADHTQVYQAIDQALGNLVSTVEDWSNARFLALSSTALQTVTGPVTFSGSVLVPAVTDWTKYLAVGAKDADARYVKSVGDTTNTRVDSVGLNTSTGVPWMHYASSFINLIRKDGDTFTGDVTLQSAKTTTTTGEYNYTPKLLLCNTGGVQAYIFGQDHVNTASQIAFQLDYNGTNIGYWWLNQDGGITSSLKGNAIFSSDTILSYSGNDWFWCKFPDGLLIQGGNASYVASDGTTGTKITLPTSFGSSFIIAVGNDIGSNANAVTVMRKDASTIYLLGREVTGGTLSDTSINYLCVGIAP